MSLVLVSYVPILLNPFTQILVILAWFAVIGVSIAGISRLSMGLPQQLAVARDSYLQEYFNNQSVYGEAGPPMYVVLQNVDWDNPNANISQANVRRRLTMRCSAATHCWLLSALHSWMNLKP